MITAVVPRDGGVRCDSCSFCSAIDLFGSGPPRGVEHVDTTFVEPGELVVPMEIHAGGCGFLKTMNPIDCTCGYYFVIPLGSVR